MKFSDKRHRQRTGELSFHLKKSWQTSGEQDGPIYILASVTEMKGGIFLNWVLKKRKKGEE